MRIAFVARELYPYVGGGIAPIVAAQARLLSQVAQVTLFTTAEHLEQHERLVIAGDPRLPPPGVEIRFVEEPDGEHLGAFLSYMHAWSARVHAALRTEYGNQGPDLIEFCDYQGDGAVTVQAAHTGASWLRETCVAVRLHTTSEICAVLNGHLPDDLSSVATHELERYCLRHADRVLWSGGDILGAYERFYGPGSIARGSRIPDGFFSYGDPEEHEIGELPGDTLRLLYMGRMERRKGVQNLVRAMTSLGREDVELTLLGADTMTGSMQTSLRTQLQLMAAGDARIHFVGALPRAEVPRLVQRHDVVVVPSIWECWPNTGREALMLNRPVLCTPVGGLCEMAQPGRSGWLTRDSSANEIARGLEMVTDGRDEVADLITREGPREVFRELTDPARLIERYTDLIEEHSRERSVRRARVSSDAPLLVSVIVPYFKLEAHVEETLDSIAAQTYQRIETLIVNDGSLREADELLWRLAQRPGVTLVTQANAGLGAARNFGVTQALGAYVLPLDADDTIEPEFVERCVTALERAPDLAYVTSWVQYMDEDGVLFGGEAGGYVPLGNSSRLVHRNNVAGTCSAVFRREVFDAGFLYSPDMTSYEDWLHYRELHDAGWHGAVIPERLFLYRVRTASMTRKVADGAVAQLFDEMRGQLRASQVQWTRSPGEGGPPSAAPVDQSDLDRSATPA